MENNKKATVTTATATTKHFAELVTDFETDYISGNSNSPALIPLARMIACSVLNKCLDPQRKTAPSREEISDNGNSSALLELKKDIVHDVKALETFATATKTAVKGGFDKNGDYTPVIVDPSLLDGLNILDGETIGDGFDLVQTAVVALLEVSAKYSNSGTGYMTRPVTVRKLSKKVLIQSADSAHFKDVETTPIQEVYRTVRRAIADSKATATDPRNGYTYIEDMATDPATGALETIYIRQGKYADLGGNDCNGLYSADRQTAEDTADILTRLDLNGRQSTVVALRLRGYGNKAIATYLGIDPANVKRTLKQVQAKCIALGIAPAAVATVATA